MVRSTTRGGGYSTLAAARAAQSRATTIRGGHRGVHSTPSHAPPSVPSGHRSGRPNRIPLPPSSSGPRVDNLLHDALPSPSDSTSDPLHDPPSDPLHDPLHDSPSDPPSGDPPSMTSSTDSSIMSRTPVHIASKDRLFPGDKVSRLMTSLYKQRLCQEGYTWSEVSQEQRAWYWRLFQKFFTFPADMEEQIYQVWYRHAGKRYADYMCELRNASEKPSGVSKPTWEAYWKKWDTPKFRDKRDKMSANRRSEVEGEGSGMSVHTGGSKSVDRYALEMAQKLGRNPNNFEVYKALHWDKKNGKWTHARSERVALELESLIANDQSLAADSNLDQSQRNKRIDDHYITAAGGISKKQRIFGIGNYGDSQIASEGTLMSQAAVERLKEEARAEGRAEVQKKLDEYITRTSTLEERVEWMMANMSTTQTSRAQDLPPHGPQSDHDGDASLSDD